MFPSVIGVTRPRMGGTITALRVWPAGRDRTAAALAVTLCYDFAGAAIARHNCMHSSDYYREEAARYRQLAEAATDADAKKELLEMAVACEEIADSIDDRRSSG